MLSAHLFLLLKGTEKTEVKASRTSVTAMILSQKRMRPESVASPSTLRSSPTAPGVASAPPSNCALLLTAAMVMSLESGENWSQRVPPEGSSGGAVVTLSAKVMTLLRPSDAPTPCTCPCRQSVRSPQGASACAATATEAHRLADRVLAHAHARRHVLAKEAARLAVGLGHGGGLARARGQRHLDVAQVGHVRAARARRAPRHRVLLRLAQAARAPRSVPRPVHGAHDLARGLVLPVDPAVHDRHLVLRERARLVRGDARGGAEGLDDVGALDEHAHVLHALRRQRQRRRHRGGQALRDVGDEHDDDAVDEGVGKVHAAAEARGEEDDRHGDGDDGDELDKEVDVAL